MSAQLSEEQIQAINEQIFAGNRIQAIKLYREYTGQGLKEAHDFLEVVTQELKAKFPDKFDHPHDHDHPHPHDHDHEAKSKGCLGALLLLAVPPATALYLLGRWIAS